ncbi:MAG: transglycosylase domain-containing protein, partial [Mucispirillum sp.]|nr:transglycosylase domain-containing protein [Mucispirillum sp.]
MLKKKYGKGLIVIAICVSAMAVIRISAEPILEGVSFSSALYDKDGKLMRLTLAGGEVYRLYVPIENISDKFKETTLIYEDKWFYFHFGVNPVSLIRAAVFFISGGNKPSGASTVTMQTARMIYDINSKSVSGKLKQIFAAIWLEIKYSKKDILEAYFNLAPYGHNIEGAEAAALIYFNVQAKDLTLFESFALAVIPQNPNGRVLTSAKGREKSLESRKRIFPLW